MPSEIYFKRGDNYSSNKNLRDHKRVLRTPSCWAVVAHAFNPSTQEAEAGESLWVQSQPSTVKGQTTKLQRNPVLEKQKQKTKQTKKEEPLHDNKFQNFNGKEAFLEIYNLPKLTQKEIENQSSPIII